MRKEDLTRWFLKYEPYLYRIASAQHSNRMDVEDAVQATFLRAWVYCERLEKADTVIVWLSRILNNECNNIFRKRKHSHEMYIGDNLDLLPTGIQEDRMLDKTIQMLLLSGLSTKEVATKLNKSCSAISGMVRRGKEKLRAAM